MLVTSLSRREFIKKSIQTAGFTLAVTATPLGYKVLNASAGMDGFAPSIWFKITPDNEITIWVPNSEMGQGVKTALPMIIADELEADWEQITIMQAPAGDGFKNPLLHNQLTVASASCRGFYAPLREAGAAGRAMLLAAAAKRWNVDVKTCRAKAGTIRHWPTERKLTYGELSTTAAELPLPKTPPLKKENEYSYMGKPMARVDIPDKVSGKAVFGLDVDIPDMHYAVLARPPAYKAKSTGFDKTAAEAITGVVKVVPTPRGIAVCATSLDAALKGREALKVTWGAGAVPDMDNALIENSLKTDLDKKGAMAASRGNVAEALNQADKKLEAEYYIPCIAHATMEPMNCTAHVQKDRLDIWVPTQGQTIAQMVGAQISKLPPDKVHVHTTLLGCGLGRRSNPDFVVEAVIVSKVVGKPVKVFWTREDDMQHDFYRAAMAHRIQAGVSAAGLIDAWQHKFSSISILKALRPQALKGGLDYYCLWGLVDNPKSPNKNHIGYDLPNFSAELTLSELPIPVAPWRSIQIAVHAFVAESFVDELAHLAGEDPVAFRLKNLAGNPRAARVLKTAAEKAGWGKTLPEDHGIGIAQHQCMGSYVAEVAEVSVDRKRGTIAVHKVTAAVDCGPVINPDPLVAQMEGGITMALSTVLKEEVQFKNGGVVSANFDDYPVISMNEVPEIEVHMVKSNDSIGGIGEPPVPPLGPAVANAVFNATKARIRRLPLTPERVLAALNAQA